MYCGNVGTNWVFVSIRTNLWLFSFFIWFQLKFLRMLVGFGRRLDQVGHEELNQAQLRAPLREQLAQRLLPNAAQPYRLLLSKRFR